MIIFLTKIKEVLVVAYLSIKSNTNCKKYKGYWHMNFYDCFSYCLYLQNLELLAYQQYQ